MPFRPLALLALPLLLAAPLALGQGSTTPPQSDWMVHMDRSTGEWRYIPDRILLLPGGTVQLMVFGNGTFSLVLDDEPDKAADIRTEEGTVRTAEFAAPLQPGEYAFHDRYHPEARGVLVVATAQGAPATTTPSTSENAAGPAIGVVPGGYESRFAPARLVVAPGAEVTFRANGTFAHSLRAVDGSFSAGDVRPGGESAFRAPTQPGEYAFECRFHRDQGMVGVLVVEAAEAPAPDPPPEESAREVPGVGALLVILAVAALALARKRM